jgi:hypothetical protein
MRMDPQSASEYDTRTTAAVKSVLVEIAQVLGAFKGKFAVIGGAVPWLLLDNKEMPHVGTIDIDLSLDAEALIDDEYVDLVDALKDQGYEQREALRVFQLVRTVDLRDGGPPIEVIVDFLVPRDAKILKKKKPVLEKFAVIKASGADLATRFHELVSVEAPMPGGGTNRVDVAVCSIPALLAMKGYALHGRLKQKDAYDIYYCIRNHKGGIDGLAKECEEILQEPSGNEGYRLIAEKFRSVDDFGPTCVRQFVQESDVLGDRTAEQWQQDAFGQVDAWLRAIMLRS